MSDNRLQDKFLELSYYDQLILDWMSISVIAIPLNKICKLSADQQQDPELIKNWHEKIVLPEVLSTLELYGGHQEH